MIPRQVVVTSTKTPDDALYLPQYFHRQAVRDGFSKAPWHVLIPRVGQLEFIREFDEPSCGFPKGPLARHNDQSIYVCLIGTKDYTDTQRVLLLATLRSLEQCYPGIQLTTVDNLCSLAGLELQGKPGFDLNHFMTSDNHAIKL